MSLPRTSSIARKLTAIIMIITTCALLLAGAGHLIVDLEATRQETASDLATLAGVIGYNASASLLFGDPESGNEVLQALRVNPSIVSACIYTREGKVFAIYGALKPADIPAAKAEGMVFSRQKTEIFKRIRLNGEVVGTIYIANDQREVNAQMIRNGEVGIFILIMALLIAFALSIRLQRIVTGPLFALANVANRITRDRDYATRATLSASREDNEITVLTNSFNQMLTEIEQRDVALLLHQTRLEDTVALRTSELTAANEELLIAKSSALMSASISAALARESALILNSATDGILGVALDGRPTFLNPAAERMLGISLADLKERSIHETFHHSRPDGSPWPEATCPMTHAFLLGEPLADVNDAFWRRDGSTFPVEYSATPIFDDDGNQLGAVLTFRDVTERRAVDRMKGEFVSTVSHELRTPLTSIRGALGLLGSGLLGPIAGKAQRMLDIAITNTDRLVRLINDILDLERVQSGIVELVRGPVEAETIMIQALEGLQSMADDARVSLAIVPATGTLWGDSDRVIQTLTNLLGNAIKFSPPETTVTLTGFARETDFLFCVADQGRGVPEDKLETIFDRFSQVDASDSRDKGGSGLGLAICQSIVAAHRGRIWVEKNEPAGSLFKFTIPLARSSAPALLIDDPVTAAHSILIVEDDLDLARVMATALESHGIQTLHAVNGSEAVRLCRKHEPSLIVLDLMLPDIDGYRVVSALRESARLRRTALLVYSAQDVGSADQSRLRLGPTEFLTKSRCSLSDFEGHVVRLLKSVTDAGADKSLTAA